MRFCTAHPCAEHADTQTTLRATFVGKRRVCTSCVGSATKMATTGTDKVRTAKAK